MTSDSDCVAPEVVDTDMNRSLNEDDFAVLKDEMPLGRIGAMQQVADTVRFLSS